VLAGVDTRETHEPDDRKKERDQSGTTGRWTQSHVCEVAHEPQKRRHVKHVTGREGGVSNVMRDVDEYKGYGLPVYARGIVQQSVRGRSSCAGYGIDIELGGVRVRPGDLIMGDDNGVLVIPVERVKEVLDFAQQVKATEDRVIAAVRAGVDPIEAHEKVKYDQMLNPA
jgi:hypothetical protein